MDPTTTRPSWRQRLTRRVTTSLGAFGATATIAVGALAPALQQCEPAPAPAPTTTAPPTTAAPAPAPSQIQQVVTITNQRRAEAGRAPLSMNNLLNSAAQAHSNDQAAMNRMTHTGSDGSNAGQRISRTGYRWRAWGENVAYGYRDAATVMNAWMNSSGHRANILNGNFTEIGVGLAYASNGRPYWTMVLARPG